MNIEQALQKVTGLTIKEFIEKAIEGGWTTELPLKQLKEQDPQFWHNKPWTSEILLDPLAWRAVGKSQGWQHTGISIHDGERVFGVLSSNKDCVYRKEIPYAIYIENETKTGGSRPNIEKDSESEVYLYNHHRFIDELHNQITK